MIVVKIGGSLGLSRVDPVLEDLRDVWKAGRALVLVHGGGRLVSELAERLGVPQRIYRGPSGFTTRYTDGETMKVFEMVLGGLFNKELVSRLLRMGVKAIGVTGVDGALLRGERKKRILVVTGEGKKIYLPGDYSGRPVSVDTGLVRLFIDNGYLPVVAPLGVDEEGVPINMDGDRVAALLASSLGAESLVLLTDVDHLYLNGRPVERISLDEARVVMNQVEGGMKRKILACIEALEGGVGEAIIASGQVESPVKRALAHEGCTVVSGYG